jgi:hypothetical protein
MFLETLRRGLLAHFNKISFYNNGAYLSAFRCHNYPYRVFSTS